MFVLREIKDTIKIEPKDFGRPTEAALADEVNRRYSNKILQNVGLCICLYDIKEAAEGIIRYGDGCSYVKLTFRIVVFRPFIGEVIQGTLKSCTKDSIRVSVGFFDDIIIPADDLQNGTEFHGKEQVHYWREYDAYMDVNERVTFRVTHELFHDLSPATAPKAPQEHVEPAVQIPKPVPYTVFGAMNEEGLGMTAWWDR